MAVLDDDDTLDPGYLARIAVEAEQHPGAAVIYTYCRGHEHAEGPFDPVRLQRENYIDGEAVINVEWLHTAGGYPENEVVEDWQLWKRLAGLGGEFICIPERLRVHGRAPLRNVTN